MGNRAVITLAQKPKQSSTGIYLHWNGGPESVLAFAEAAQALGVGLDDDSYTVARLAQIISNYFGGTLSIGIGALKTLDCDNYDNGVYKLSIKNGQAVLKQSKDGKAPWKTLNNDAIRKHVYWQKTDEEPGILQSVLDANKQPFAKAA